MAEKMTVEEWPIGWDGKPKPFTELTHAERRRLMTAKKVAIPAGRRALEQNNG